jgi:hypothetical protein
LPRKPRRLTFALTALCALALAAGCGGDDANQFREDYNATVDRLSKINGEIGSATSGSAGESSAAIAKQLDEIADAAEKAHSELVEDLRSMADAAKANDPQKAQTAARELAKSGQQITAAETALRTAVDG